MGGLMARATSRRWNKRTLALRLLPPMVLGFEQEELNEIRNCVAVGRANVFDRDLVPV